MKNFNLSKILNKITSQIKNEPRLEVDPRVTDTESQTCKPCKEALRDLGYSATCAGFRQLQEDKRNFKKVCEGYDPNDPNDLTFCKMAWEEAIEEMRQICRASPGSLSCCDYIQAVDDPINFLYVEDLCQGPSGISPEGATDCLDILREKYMSRNCPQCHSDIVTQCKIAYWENEMPWGNGYRGCSQVLSSDMCCGRPRVPYENTKSGM